MSEKMRAAVMHKPGDIRIEEVAIPSLPQGHALVKVAAVGVCGSDIPRMLFKGAHNMPLICGHEFSGYIERINGEIGDFEPGNLVTVPPLIPCFHCSQCEQEMYSRCENYDYFGSRRDGAYAEYVAVPASNLLKVPATVEPTAASMVDPAAIALYALRKTSFQIGHRVAIVGCGAIGLFAIQWAKLMGAGEILAVDIDQKKIEQAKQAGATQCAVGNNLALAEGHYNVVVEAAGQPNSINLAMQLLTPGGHAVFIGIPTEEITLESASFDRFLRQEISLHGAWNSFSAPFPGDEWRTTLDKLAEGALKWDFIISHDKDLEELPNMMEVLKDRSEFTSKIIFRP